MVRGGYGVYYNTSVYQSIAQQMSQQYPLSKSLSVANSPANPLTLANGFNAAPGVTPNTFAIDPNFLVGYSQNWQLSVQRDLFEGIVLTGTYLGIKGTRGMQLSLPNTYPTGVADPCPSCPAGYTYLSSNGNSTREAGQLQVLRRFHNGFSATVQYTYSKAIDDGVLGGKPNAAGVATQTWYTAQDWLNLAAERGLSGFDQRHLLTVKTQYSTGSGLRGGALMKGWRGELFKGWTFLTDITAGSGLPQTPIFFAPVSGTGVTGTLRPDYVGGSIYGGPPGYFLNAAAFAPAVGHFGTAGRDSITGPSQFVLNASMGRTFREVIDLRVDSTNALNHVAFTSWNTVIGSQQFGLPAQAGAMRNLQVTVRWRF